MKIKYPDLIKPNNNYLRNGFILAGLNAVIALFCIVSFLGVLLATGLFSNWLSAVIGNEVAVPFPAPILLLDYPLLFLVAWVIFAKHLPVMSFREVLITGVVGTSPLMFLSLIGYAKVAWSLLMGDFKANQMLAVSVLFYATFSTLIILAGICCLIVIIVFRKK